MESELKYYVNKNGLNNNITFIGFINHVELNELLMESKAMLIDTLQDNNMVSIPESIVSGTPVITNRIPTNSYIISKNKLGIAKDGWNEDDIQEVVNNNNVYVDNCIKFRDRLTNEYSAKQFIDLYMNFKA